MNSREPDGQAPARPEQANGHSNLHSVSRIASTGNGVAVAVAGEIDISNAEEFSDQVRGLMEGAEGEVVLTFDNCGFIDSTGLRTLIALAEELRTRGQTLVLSGLTRGPRKVFEITGLLDGGDFEIRDSRRM